MIKIIIAFLVFVGLAFFMLMRGGGNIDLGGEHGASSTSHQEEAKPAADANKAAPTAATPDAKAAEAKPDATKAEPAKAEAAKAEPNKEPAKK